MQANRTNSIFFRALITVLYLCFFLVQFSTRAFSAKEFNVHAATKVSTAVKSKINAAAQHDTKVFKHLNKRFELQPSLVIAALIFILAALIFTPRKEYGFTVLYIRSVRIPSWSLRGPPAALPAYWL